MRRTFTAGLIVAAAVAVLGGSACSSSSSGGGGSGSASVTGTIQGATVPSNDAVGLSSVASNNGVTEAAVGVIVTSVNNACGVLQDHGNPANATALVVEVAAMGSSVATGTYNIVSSGFGATASYAAQDQNCNTTLNETASSGTVTISSNSGSSVSGTFDLTFDGDHLTGSFTAPICSYSTSTDGGTAACM
jgi:hypothetical protein